MSREAFERMIETVTGRIAGAALDDRLRQTLEDTFPEDGETFGSLAALCEQGVREGWLANREHGGIRFGRIVRPGPATAGFSVDVVEMDGIVGPHHRHPNGEIDMIVPQDPQARFDGRGRGWLVYAPGSAHFPTVTGGRAIVLYLLPGGAIEFTPAAGRADAEADERAGEKAREKADRRADRTSR